jgi:chromatin remodeling complex protein RSC6
VAKKKAAAKKPVAKKKAAAKKPVAKKKAALKKPAKKKIKRKPNPSFMRPLQPNAILGAVVGNKPLPRTQVTKKIWAYIKKNNLQDTQNKRMINADDKLKAIFDGKKQVSMFEMTKLVNKHMK